MSTQQSQSHWGDIECSILKEALRCVSVIFFLFSVSIGLCLFSKTILSLRSGCGVYAVFLRHADQTDLAVFCTPAPPSGKAVPCAPGDHCLHQPLCYDLHRSGGALLHRLQPAGAVQSGQNCLQRAGTGTTAGFFSCDHVLRNCLWLVLKTLKVIVLILYTAGGNHFVKTSLYKNILKRMQKHFLKKSYAYQSLIYLITNAEKKTQ